MAAAVGYMLLRFLQFAVDIMRSPAADVHEQRGDVFNALIGVGFGLATGIIGILFGLRLMSKRS